MGMSILEIYNSISVQQYKTDMGFKALVEGVHENMFVIPEYQRKYRWRKMQVEELAASLIRELPIPPIYTYRNKKGQLEILDGQQRVMSLYFYYIGKFFKNQKQSVFDYQEIDVDSAGNFVAALEKKYDIVQTSFSMQVGSEQCDISYQNLPIELRRKVDYRAISVVEIKISDQNKKDEILHKIFANLNNGGKQLSHQELRNGIYPCAFNRAINKINKCNIKWRTLWGTMNDEGKDVEMLYRLAALKLYVTNTKNGYKLDGYRNSTKDMIDRFAEEAFSFNSKEITQYVKSIEAFISALDISRKYFLKTTLLEGLYVVFEKRGIRCDITDEICEEILEKTFFKASTAGGTISITNMNKRWKGIYGILSKYDK
ncbi:MAG: DUF262 domain-containing protein [Lachnospiraceae bacterium]|nr:DUF262 domain-containing protein [Lachnospiraceae bacterium]